MFYSLESLDCRVLDVHVRVHSVTNQLLDNGVLRSREEEICPELEIKNCDVICAEIL